MEQLWATVMASIRREFRYFFRFLFISTVHPFISSYYDSFPWIRSFERPARILILDVDAAQKLVMLNWIFTYNDILIPSISMPFISLSIQFAVNHILGRLFAIIRRIEYSFFEDRYAGPYLFFRVLIS